MPEPSHANPAIQLPLPRATELRSRPPGYAGFFRCFNSGQFFEAHEELEPCWLEVRGGPIADFYKALIQVAGAFVHWRQGRTAPARRLIRRAAELLQPFPSPTAGLDLDSVRRRLSSWETLFTERDPPPIPATGARPK